MNPERLSLDHAAVQDLLATFDSRRQHHWRQDRSAYAPQVFRSSNDEVTVWMLVTARPHTAAHKVADIAVTRQQQVDPTGGNGQVVGQAVGSLLEDVAAAHPDHAATRIEVHDWLAGSLRDLEGVLTQLAYVPSRPPLASIPSTTGSIEGWVRWIGPLRPESVRMPPYMGQTTDFTCGAVSLITALDRPDRSVLTDPSDRASNRRDELRWWRKATNMPACDPLTLAIADAEALGTEAPRPVVYLTDDSPILLEDYTGLERERRAILQELSREEAHALGVDIRPEWPGAEALADMVETGLGVQLLIDEVPMHDEEIPHWITGYAVTETASGQRALVVQDPWVDAEHGETWVDADQLPIALTDLDLMARFGRPSYRSAIVVPR